MKVEDNPQLGYYGTALQKTSKKALETIDVGIVQPRLTRWFGGVEYSADELKEWNKKLTLGAEKALLQIGSTSPTLVTGGGAGSARRRKSARRRGWTKPPARLRRGRRRSRTTRDRQREIQEEAFDAAGANF